MSDIDPEKLKVAELRDELKARGLDTKGNKPALVARLKEALESTADEAEVDQVEQAAEADNEEVQEIEDSNEGEEANQPEAEEADQPEAEPEDEAQLVEDGGDQEETEEPQPEQENVDTAAAEENTENVEEKADDAEEAMEASQEEETNGDADEEPPVELGDEFRTIDEATDDAEDGNTDRKRKRSRSRDRHRRSRSRDRHRRDDRDKRRERHSTPPPRKVEMDDTTWESSTSFVLDRYEADLNLRFDDNGIKAHPLTVDGFAYMWSGVRAMYGVTSGKVAYEVKVIENLNVDHLSKDEKNPHVLRVGWSVNSTSLNLGEEALSYGYGGTGKASTEEKFKEYGQTFGPGDVITAYLDMESDPVVMSFAKNGEDLGECFTVAKETLGEQALFPHLMTKNVEFECNFGQREGPYFALSDGFKFLEEVPQEERVRGHTPPATKEECEVMMMVGLPGSGKTYWVSNYVKENTDKQWNVLGTNSIISKMKVTNLGRKGNYKGRWDVLIDKAGRCLNRMIEIAARKKRHYIIDQTNVFASARRRKMQPFEGFLRKAIVVLPTDEVFKTRVKARTEEQGKEVPESAVNEMKANLTLPEAGEGQPFASVEFTEEEPEQEAREKLVETYRKQGRDALPPPDKRFRKDSRDFRDNRGFRGGYDKDRSRGGGYRGRGGNSSWRSSFDRRGGGGGGYRGRDDRSRSRDSGYSGGGGYKGGRGGGYGGGWGNNQGWNGGGGYQGNKWNSGYQQGGYGAGGWGGYNTGYSSGGWGGGYNSGYGGQGGWGGYNRY